MRLRYLCFISLVKCHLIDVFGGKLRMCANANWREREKNVFFFQL